MITTAQCSICSQLNNKPRVVVTDFRLHHTCSIITHQVVLLEAYFATMRIQPRHNNYKHVREHAHLNHVHVHYSYVPTHI